MSTALPPRPRTDSRSNADIYIIASDYNFQFTDALVTNAQEELSYILPRAKVNLFRVPGAFEIPVACAKLLSLEIQPTAIITLGLIIRGQTQHGDLVAESVTNNLQKIACESQIPVIHEVLLVDDEKQAYARCIGSQLNRGKEAARAAQAMIELFSDIGLHQDNKRKTTRSYPSNV